MIQFTEGLPITKLRIGVPEPLARKRKQGRWEVLDPICVPALVDSGSQVTLVKPRILKALMLKSTGCPRFVKGLESAKIGDSYEVRLTFMESTLRGKISPFVVQETTIYEYLGDAPFLDAIVGQDVLRCLTFWQDGPRQLFSLEHKR